MLTWVFGDPKESTVTRMEDKTISGELKLERAEVSWTLSTDERNLPPQTVSANQRAYRSLLIDGKEIDFSSGFTDLHTVTYKNILNGNGFGLQDAQPSLLLCRDIMRGVGTTKY